MLLMVMTGEAHMSFSERRLVGREPPVEESEEDRRKEVRMALGVKCAARALKREDCILD
jgi:hypothetical protein